MGEQQLDQVASDEIVSVPAGEFQRLLGAQLPAVQRAEAFAALARVNVLYMIARAWSGHIGTSFSSLEIAWTRVVFDGRTIAGDILVPFFTEGYEGFDINDQYDWIVAERVLADGSASLPPVTTAPYEAQWVNSNSIR